MYNRPVGAAIGRPHVPKLRRNNGRAMRAPTGAAYRCNHGRAAGDSGPYDGQSPLQCSTETRRQQSAAPTSITENILPAYYGLIAQTGGYKPPHLYICTGGEKSEMMHYLLICRSLTYAQRTERILERAGVTAVVTRAPQTITIEGCGYCVKVPGRHFANALIALKDTDLHPKKVFGIYENGGFVEVDV